MILTLFDFVKIKTHKTGKNITFVCIVSFMVKKNNSYNSLGYDLSYDFFLLISLMNLKY